MINIKATIKITLFSHFPLLERGVHTNRVKISKLNKKNATQKDPATQIKKSIDSKKKPIAKSKRKLVIEI